MNDVFVSGFNEAPPDYPGGIWILRDDQVVSLYRGFGVFGLCWLGSQELLLGVTRVDELPLLAFKASSESGYARLPIEYRNYIPARRAHGICAFGNRLFIVAAQGDPDSVLCTNEDFAGIHVGKVIISNIQVDAERILISDSSVWNPYECNHHHHYNDILADERAIYLASFSTCDAEKKYINRGSVTRFSHDFFEHAIISDELVSPHSLQIFNDKLYVCSSTTSSLISISLSGETPTPSLEFKTLNNFIRGLYVTTDYFFIGLSRSAGRTNADHLTDSINGILRFNRNDGSTIRIEMPTDCDNLYSIVSSPDMCLTFCVSQGCSSGRPQNED